MQLFYTLTTNEHEPQRRLRGSTLTFGFGFFKAPFLLASSGFLFLNPCWSMTVKSASDRMSNELLGGSYDPRYQIQICRPHKTRFDLTKLVWTHSERLFFNLFSYFLDLLCRRGYESLANSDWFHVNERKHFSLWPQPKSSQHLHTLYQYQNNYNHPRS